MLHDFFEGLPSQPGFTTIFEAMKALQNNNLSGAAFEAFALEVLKADPLLQVAAAYRRKDAPKEILKKLSLRPDEDNGTDIIIVDRNDRIIAVQVKFRQDTSSSISWRELGTFWGESVNADARIVFTTASDVDPSGKAPEDSKLIKICYHDLASLDPEHLNLAVQILAGNAPQAAGRRDEKPHQSRAIEDILRELQVHGKGVFHSACGTGKTLTSERVMEGLFENKGGTALFLVPSLNLLRQVMVEWARELADDDRFAFIAVCSDNTVSTANEEGNRYDITVANVGVPVTSSADEVRAFLSKPRNSDAVRIVFATYQSSPLIGEATSDSEPFEIIFYDEAHRTVSAKTKQAEISPFSYALSDGNVEARLRLFMTATPKIRRFRAEQTNDEVEYLSMDDVTVYGPVIHRYTMTEAARDKVTCKVKIVAVAINEAELSVPLKGSFTHVSDIPVTAGLMANVIGVEKAIAISNAAAVITYHSRLQDAERFSRIMEERLEGWNVAHISGKQTAAKRGKLIDGVKRSEQSLTTNVRCLTEGVDFPAVDMVAILANIQSKIDITQIVGRAVRRPENSEKEFGYVMLPLVIGSSQSDEEMFRSQGFEVLWDVVSAIADADDDFMNLLNEARLETGQQGGTRFQSLSQQLRERIDLVGISSVALCDAITVRILEKTTSNFYYGFGQLKKHLQTFGTFSMPNGFMTEDGFPLGNWISNTTYRWRNGTLSSDKVEMLKEIGLSSMTADERFDNSIAILERYFEANGRSYLTSGIVSEDYALGAWLKTVGNRRKQGLVPEDRLQRLDALGVVWEPDGDLFEKGYSRLLDFHQTYGHARVKLDYVDPEGFHLYNWLRVQRTLLKQGKITAERVAALETLGVKGGVLDETYARNIGIAERYLIHNGSSGHIPTSAVFEDIKLGEWIAQAKNRIRRGKVPEKWVQRLADIGIVVEASTRGPKPGSKREAKPEVDKPRAWDEAFNRGLLKLTRYKEVHGHTNVHQAKGIFEDFNLGSWLHLRLRNWRNDMLSQEQIDALVALGVEKYRPQRGSKIASGVSAAL
jgi:superfamily II DNA or RNA helicase